MSKTNTAIQTIFLAGIRGNDDLTVGNLRELTEEPQGGFILNLTVGEMLGKGTKKGRGRGRKAAASEDGIKDVTTRTIEGRVAYDNAMYDFIASKKGEEVKSRQIREAIGGTPVQMRAAVNRLIEEESVSYTGNAQAMRYTKGKKKHDTEVPIKEAAA